MSRRRNDHMQEPANFTFDHPSTAASKTWKIWKAPYPVTIDSITYTNPTGLATDASNRFTGAVKNGSTSVAAMFDTNSSGGAAIAADTPADATLAADPAPTLAAGDILTFVTTLAGTQTLPAGRIQITARRVG